MSGLDRVFSDQATQFVVSSPIELHRRDVGRNRVLDWEPLLQFFRESGLGEKRGVYAFLLGTARGALKPCYVGSTTKSLYDRFKVKSHKAGEIAAHHGTPYLILIYPEHGRGRESAIAQLEDHLIKDGYWKNHEIMNDKKTPGFKYKIEGVFPTGRGKAKAAGASALKRAFGW
jgi:hypothetical protein